MQPSTTPSLEDRIAIQDLIARYAWALDTGDIDAVANCFTVDGVVIEEVFEDPDRWEGRDGVRALAEHYRTSAGFPGRQHHVSQSIVTGDNQRCAVKSFAFVTECREVGINAQERDVKDAWRQANVRMADLVQKDPSVYTPELRTKRDALRGRLLQLDSAYRSAAAPLALKPGSQPWSAGLVEKLRTVGDAVAYLNSKVSA